jgi:hypothetical protein
MASCAAMASAQILCFLQTYSIDKQTEHFLISVYLSLSTRYIIYLIGLHPWSGAALKRLCMHTLHNAHLVLALFLARV